jgi:nucleotide-binding universal stress UspA family protein
MYKKILIPTDGSDIAQSAAHAGLAFAKDMNAEVVSIFVIPEYQYPLNIEMVPTNFPSAEDYRASMRKLGEIYMDQLRSKACDVGVVFSSIIEFSDKIAPTIVSTAEKQECDLIFIGSHGRSGWERALLGSVTAKVLSIATIPVLVFRSTIE